MNLYLLGLIAALKKVYKDLGREDLEVEVKVVVKPKGQVSADLREAVAPYGITFAGQPESAKAAPKPDRELTKSST